MHVIKFAIDMFKNDPLARKAWHKTTIVCLVFYFRFALPVIVLSLTYFIFDSIIPLILVIIGSMIYLPYFIKKILYPLLDRLAEI